MYISRKLEDAILRNLNSREIIAIVGSRQCGKTTLIRHIFENIKEAVFLTFEDKKILDLFVHDIDAFIVSYIKPYKYVFIDEFQYAKKGGKLLKYIFDTAHTKIFISGSSTIDLTVQAVKYLVGRIFVFSLFPLDFEEFLNGKDAELFSFYKKNKRFLEKIGTENHFHFDNNQVSKLQDLYEEYLIYGGYPRVVTSSSIEEKKLVLKNIYNTYFLREVKDILGLVDDYKLSQMLKALALQVGNLIEYQEISKVSELSYQTVKHYLSFLEKTLICKLVKPFFKNKRREIVKNPKIYFIDTGLRNYIVDDFRSINERTDNGSLLENGIAMQLTKQERVFRYWRTKYKAEVDFVIELANSKSLALEVKKTVDKTDFISKSSKDFKALHPDIPLIFCSFHLNEEIKNEVILVEEI
ncbi:hypothetical protein A2230_01230 [candidate division WOR-1 bacterium RIFOXYA2_FULL_36_21]|uniref:AAA+ ATPase domain-containing protein n=1 Tax=candidate division WOR-1 bacterium RIFOXYB2_FULL_36_35 TaxID=1802578 RepID=A0A1F4RYW1_UNCSA|nr:MAG: hypothetical protein A2230_01230 [candidate division WOR-1 bacterium RIFOXYA2_FULL_36_21]OGC13337.1 MAG: hypothetical protein A2290_04720 [candidate division WOR-1 bacterium RIFOXYB2_FULL_36_35]OGC21044.1 MAG: hypothetical protein A2282_08485 [candidate division WOR-1 bacterium RIFOXYA12_FULL_36_13]